MFLKSTQTNQKKQEFNRLFLSSLEIPEFNRVSLDSLSAYPSRKKKNLAVLFSLARRYGNAFINEDRLAALNKSTRRTIQRDIQSFKNDGFLSVYKSPGVFNPCNRYFINPELKELGFDMGTFIKTLGVALYFAHALLTPLFGASKRDVALYYTVKGKEIIYEERKLLKERTVKEGNAAQLYVDSYQYGYCEFHHGNPGRFLTEKQIEGLCSCSKYTQNKERRMNESMKFSPMVEKFRAKYHLSPAGCLKIMAFNEAVLSQVFEKLAVRAVLDPVAFAIRVGYDLSQQLGYAVDWSVADALRKQYALADNADFYLSAEERLKKEGTTPTSQAVMKKKEWHNPYRTEWDYDHHTHELIEKLRSMPVTESIPLMVNSERYGIKGMLIKEWPDDLQELLDYYYERNGLARTA